MSSAIMPSISYCHVRDEDGEKYITPLLEDNLFWEWEGNGFSDFEEQIQALKAGYYKVLYHYYLDQDYEEGYAVTGPYPVIDELVAFKKSFFMAPWIDFKNWLDNKVFFCGCLLKKVWAVEYEFTYIGYHGNRGYLPAILFERFIKSPELRYGGKCKRSVTRYYF